MWRGDCEGDLVATSVILPAWSLLNDDRSLLCSQNGFLQGVFIRIGGFLVHGAFLSKFFFPKFIQDGGLFLPVQLSVDEAIRSLGSLLLFRGGGWWSKCFCLGGGGVGDLNGFHVRLLQHKCFSFIVVNKNICLRIYLLRSYSCKQFKLFFHNWRVLDWYKKYTQ